MRRFSVAIVYYSLCGCGGVSWNSGQGGAAAGRAVHTYMYVYLKQRKLYYKIQSLR